MNKKHKSNVAGFTLLEVLVALAVLAIAIGAILTANNASVRTVTRIKDKTVAQWVGQNVIAQIHLKMIPLKMGATIDDKTTMLGSTWYWSAQAMKTPDPFVGKVILRIHRAKEKNHTEVMNAYFPVQKTA